MGVPIQHPEAGTQSVLTLAAGAFIFNEAGQVLLIRENYGQFRYGPPGGAVDEGESPQAAAVRETMEEANLVVVVRDLIGVRWSDADGDRFLGFGFRCEVVSGEPAIVDPGEISEIGWFDPYHPPQPTTNMARLLLVPAAEGRSGLVFSTAD